MSYHTLCYNNKVQKMSLVATAVWTHQWRAGAELQFLLLQLASLGTASHGSRTCSAWD